ncbi:TetR family transcriptional regulator [Calidifontibacter terrae]
MTEELRIEAEAARVAGWTDKRQETARRITHEARWLAAERGFDEFTLDDLALAADVSRRTLFNYFEGKMEAVLGLPPATVHDCLQRFVAGGPSGDLLPDALQLARDVVEDKAMDRHDWASMQQAMERNPKVLAASAVNFRQVSDDIHLLISRREGCAPNDPRAVMTMALVLALFDATVRLFIADDTEQIFGDIFDRNLAALRDLVTPAS